MRKISGNEALERITGFQVVIKQQRIGRSIRETKKNRIGRRVIAQSPGITGYRRFRADIRVVARQGIGWLPRNGKSSCKQAD
jgi:hypothetical protein